MNMDKTTPDSISGSIVQSIDWNRSRLELWNSFCQRYSVGEDSVPLFECDENGFVQSKEIGGLRRRKILQRTSAMEALMRQEANKVVSDYKAATGVYDGIIYMMHIRSSDSGIVPCYIGKSETAGKTRGGLSANLMRLATDTSKFGRWGDNYAYHIGDLSSIVLPGHDLVVQREKYRSWATALFESINTDRPRLRQPVFFWVRAWKREEVGIWTEFGPTRLSFLEYLLIGIASSIFPRELLNREGHSRHFKATDL
jgi:hypothetical protein